MSKIGIIIKREYLRRVIKKTFLLITFLTPFCIVALVALPMWLSSIKSDEVKTVAIIDETGKYAPLFEDTEHFYFQVTSRTLQQYRENPDKDIFAVINITGDLLENPQAGGIYSEKQIPLDLTRLIDYTLREQMELDKLATYDIPHLKEIVEEAKVNFSIRTIKWGTDGTEKASSSMVAGMVGLFSTLLIYMFVLLYANMVMQGVLEEKTNRIIELIISSVKPFELMVGKIIGILLVGLTQVFLWGVMLFGIGTIAQSFLFGKISPEAMMTADPNMELVMQQPGGEMIEFINTINLGELGIMFILFFMGGFLLYAALFAAIGSAIDSPEDSQQFMIPVSIVLIFALYAGIYSMNNPDGPLAFWCSMIPVTSPVVMMIRIPFEIPWWQTALSLFLLYGSAFGLIWIAGKIYRVGILMYGKKPSLKEIARWINYK